MVATKFYSGHDEDSTVNWAEYAKTTPDNLLRMELEFLTALDWKIYVSNDEFFEKVATIERKLAQKQGLTRGWFTYMELDSLLPSIQITKSFLHFTFIIGLSYTAFVATIVASVFLVSQIPGTYLNSSSRKATISDAIGSLSEPQITAHTTIGHDAVNTSESETETYTSNNIRSPLINSEYIEFDMDLLDRKIDRLGDAVAVHNATESNSENQMKPETFNWSVIVNSLAKKKQKIESYTDRFGHTFSKFKPSAPFEYNRASPTNTTIYDSIVLQPNSGMFQNYFNGIKMKFV